MSDSNYIDFPGLIDHAMRDVVRKALQVAAKQGLPGDHHFFISFRTEHPGVSISQTLLSRHPHEMTVVLQHQFWDLKIYDDRFSITLSFNNVPEKLVIPFQAMTAFADPSVKFGLQFHTFTEEEMEELLDEDDLLERLEKESLAISKEAQQETKKNGKKKSGKVGGDDVVVTLDAFRKKSGKSEPSSD